MERLAEILKELKSKTAAEAAFITSGDGLVLESVNDAGIDLESLAAYAASNIMMSEHMGESAHCGAPESVIVIYQHKALVMAPVGPVIAVVLGSGESQLGNLRLRMRRGLTELAAALTDELHAAPARPIAHGPEDPELNGNRPLEAILAESSINLR